MNYLLLLKKYLILFWINSIIICSVDAQLDTSLSNIPFLFLRNNFEIGINNGFNRTQFIEQSGSFHPKGSVAYVHSLEFSYHFNLSDQNDITPSISLGAQPFYYKAGKFTDGWGYYQQAIYNPFVTTELNLGRRLFLPSRSLIKIKGGAGVTFLFGNEYHTGVSFGNNDELDIEIYSDDPVNPYITMAFKLGNVLKNNNIIKLGMGYNYSFKPIFSGDYKITYNNEVSSGNLVNKGNIFTVSLSYEITTPFTPNEVLDYSRLNVDSLKAFKREIRKKRRYINPKDIFIISTVGTANGINKSSKEQDYYYKRKSFASFIPNFTIEKGIKKNYFGEISFTGFEYYDVIAQKEAFFSSGGNAFISFQLLVGINKKYINNKNNRNYITLHSGIGIAVADTKRRLVGGSSSANIDPITNDTLWIHQAEDYQLRQVYPLLYAGISKDIQLAKGLYITLLYKYNQGLYKVYEQRVTHYISPTETIPVSISINGSYHTFQFGLKYRIKHPE